MRVLLATDGSEGARVAAQLVEHTPWPVGTVVELVRVLEEPAAELQAVPWPDHVAGYEDADEATDRIIAAQMELEDVAIPLRARGLEVEPVLLHGDAAEAIVARVAGHRPDLVVTGTRGLGGLRRIVLGSVSGALVDRSPVPVLVARRTAVERVIVATDGSDVADQAVATVAGWRFLADAEIRVLSVAADRPVWWPAEMVAGMPDIAIDDLRTDGTDLAEHERIAADAADRLAASGFAAHPRTVTGQPGSTISAEAAAWDADLVVLGSHGRTGLTRIVLGSVARDVLQHAPCSVVVVRRHAEPVRLARRAPAVSVRPLATI